MPRKSKNPRAQRQRARGGMIMRPSRPLWMDPPVNQTGTIVDQVYRYRCTASTSDVVSVGSLLRACGLVALQTQSVGGLGSLSPIAMSMRLKRVRMWGSATASASPQLCTVSVDFDTDNVSGGNPGLQFTDTVSGTDTPAFIDVVPPKGSYASFWHSQVEASTGIMVLNCTQPTIMDLHVEWVLNDDDGIAGLGLTINTASQVVGHVYAPFLTTLGGSSLNWTPIGRIVNGIA